MTIPAVLSQPASNVPFPRSVHCLSTDESVYQNRGYPTRFLTTQCSLMKRLVSIVSYSKQDHTKCKDDETRNRGSTSAASAADLVLRARRLSPKTCLPTNRQQVYKQSHACPSSTTRLNPCSLFRYLGTLTGLITVCWMTPCDGLSAGSLLLANTSDRS